MLGKSHLLNFLHANDLSEESSDEDVRGALSAAGWPKADVEAALVTLRHPETEAAHGSAQHLALKQLFRADVHLAPEVLSSLLGVGLRVSEDSITAPPLPKVSHYTVSKSVWWYVGIFVGAVLIGAFVWGVYMVVQYGYADGLLSRVSSWISLLTNLI